MRRRKVRTSAMGKIVEYKLDPGVFIVEFPGTKEKVSLGQPPDAVKRFQQVGYAGENGISTFVIADSKTQGDSISWNLIEFPLLYALYFILVKKNGNMIPAFFAGQSPKLVGLERDVNQAMAMMKYSNYGVDSIEELDVLDIPEATREALRKEILGLPAGNEIKDTDSLIDPVDPESNPRDEHQSSDLAGRLRRGRDASDARWEIYVQQKRRFQRPSEVPPERLIRVDTTKRRASGVGPILDALRRISPLSGTG